MSLLDVTLRDVVDRVNRVFCEHIVAKHVPLAATYLTHEGKEYVDVYPVLSNVRFHRFRLKDAGKDMHNHPAPVGVSFVLAGGYTEQRFGRALHKTYRAGDINVITDGTFHRLLLCEEDAWSLWITFGGEEHPWGFLQAGKFVPSHRYFRRVKGDNVRSRK